MQVNESFQCGQNPGRKCTSEKKSIFGKNLENILNIQKNKEYIKDH